MNTPFDRPYFNLLLVGTTGGRLIPTGKIIAERINSRFIALDLEIYTREGYSPDDLRALFGVARLRRVEADLSHELALQRGSVIGINCGTLLDRDTRERLTEAGTVLALTCALNETLRRLYIAQGARFQDPKVRAIALDAIRRDQQALRVADPPRLDTTRLSVEQVADRALAFWRTNVPHSRALNGLPRKIFDVPD
jgi:shikimate kinase